MSRKGRLDGLDNVLLGLFSVSFAIPALISAYGLDIRLMAIPSICYGFWILIIGYFQPKVSFSDFPERSQIERMRGWTYVVGLPLCLLLNFIFGFLLPKDFITFILGSFVVSTSLLIVMSTVPRYLLKKEIKKMDKTQFVTFKKMLSYTGGSMLYSSMALLFLTMSIIWINYSPIFVIGFSIASAILLVVSFDRHRKSSKYADELATLLKSEKKKKLKKKRR